VQKTDQKNYSLDFAFGIIWSMKKNKRVFNDILKIKVIGYLTLTTICKGIMIPECLGYYDGY